MGEGGTLEGGAGKGEGGTLEGGVGGEGRWDSRGRGVLVQT